jgi:hypothetical protein
MVIDEISVPVRKILVIKHAVQIFAAYQKVSMACVLNFLQKAS